MRGCGCVGSQTLSLIIIIIKFAFCYVLRYPFLGGCLGCVRGPPHSLPFAHAASSPKSCLGNASPSPEKGTNGAEFPLNPPQEQPLKAEQPGRGERSILARFPASPSACAPKRGDYRGQKPTPSSSAPARGEVFQHSSVGGGNTQRPGSLCCASKIPLQAPCSRRRGASAEPARSCRLSGRAVARLPSYFW